MKPADILPDAPDNAVVPPSDDEQGVWSDVGLSAWEYRRIVDRLGREPNGLELEMFGVMWSEHCSYKNTRALLRRLPTAGERVVQGPGENAGAVRVGRRTVVFKIESHNHPSFVEPYHGAATGVGGILRDIFTMGARPVAVLESLRFGRPGAPRQQELLEGVRAGVRDYADGAGVPAVASEIRFDDSYESNCLVNAMAVGVADGPLAKGLAEGPGNPVLVFGRPTGRDGVRSASFASKELDASVTAAAEGQEGPAAASEAGAAAVPTIPQGDPEAGRRLMEATLELLRSGAVAGMQDMGAAGFTSSACEMAARAGTGIEIDVSRVPKADDTIEPFEVMLSETQERMLAVVRAGREAEVTAVLDKYGLTYGFCGVVTDDGMVRVRDGQAVLAEVPARLLADDAPCYVRPMAKPEGPGAMGGLPEPDDYGAVLDALLRSPTVVYGPGPGAAVVDLAGGKPSGKAGSRDRGAGDETAVAVTTYGNGRHVFLDPYIGTQGCVAAAARRVAAAGARPVAVTNGLNFGSPEKPHIYWQLERSLTGMAVACRGLGTPVTGGNVSLFNETDGRPVQPTPIIGMVGVLASAERALPAGFQRAGHVVLLLGSTRAELGGSEYAAVWHGVVAGPPPKPDLASEKLLYDLMQRLTDHGLLAAAHAVADGGLAVALAEMCIHAAPGAGGCHVSVPAAAQPGGRARRGAANGHSSGTGREVPAGRSPGGRAEPNGSGSRLDGRDDGETWPPSVALFSESHGRIVVEAPVHAAQTVSELAAATGVPCRILGRVADGELRIVDAAGRLLILRSTAALAAARKEAPA